MTKRTFPAVLFRSTACLTPALLSVIAGCGPAPAPEGPPQPVQPAAPAKPGPLPALTLPARALPSQRAAIFIGKVGDRNLYLVGGERWLVDRNGKMEREKQPFLDRSGVPLSLTAVAPVAPGSTSYLGWNNYRVFSFDDMLGVPKLLAEAGTTITHVRTGPGAVLVFAGSASAVLDPRTGAAKTGLLPSFPARDVVYADDKRGIADTTVAGIGITTDSGQTWKPLKVKVSTYLTDNLYTDGNDLYLREMYGSRAARIDVATTELGDWGEKNMSVASGTTPIETWIKAMGNPIESAVRNGIDAGKSTGVVAWSGTAARVDLATGAFVETVTIPGAAGQCRATTSAKNAYLVCTPSGGKRGVGGQLFVVRTDGKLEVEAVKEGTFGGSSATEILGSPAGGLMTFQGCGDKYGGLCVRQPGGTFSTIENNLVAYPGAAAPLADGRIVSVGSRRDGDKLLLELVASTARERKVLEELSFDKESSFNVARPEEGADGVLRFLLMERKKGEATLYLYEYELGKKGFDKTPLPDLEGANFADGVLLGVPKEGKGLKVSHDHGASFRDVDLPAGSRASISTVNRLGIMTNQYVRVGWEPLPEAASPLRDDAPARLKLAPGSTDRTMADLTCKTSGTGKTGPVLAKYDYEVPAAFDLKPAPKGTRRTTVSHAVSPAQTTFLLAIEGREPPSGSTTKYEPSTWVLRWIDGREIDAKPRSLSAKAPYTDSYPSVRGAWSREGKLFLSMVVGGKAVLVRSKGAGIETAEVPNGMLPASGAPQAFSADGNILAYMADKLLVMWKSGEAPRPVALVNLKTSTMLGAPTKDGIPVLVDSEGTTYYRVFPLPSGKMEGSANDQWVSASWDGWTRSPSLFTRPDTLAFCDAKPAGSAFRSSINAPSIAGRVTIDGGGRITFSYPRYDIVTDGQAMCLESIAAPLYTNAAVSVKTGASIKQVAGLDLVRVAGKGKKADITHAGKLDKVPLHTMTCEVATTR